MTTDIVVKKLIFIMHIYLTISIIILSITINIFAEPHAERVQDDNEIKDILRGSFK